MEEYVPRRIDGEAVKYLGMLGHLSDHSLKNCLFRNMVQYNYFSE